MEFTPEILKVIGTQGIFAMLFVWLFVDMRKETKMREERLLLQLQNNTSAYEKIVEAVNALKEQMIKGGK